MNYGKTKRKSRESETDMTHETELRAGMRVRVPCSGGELTGVVFAFASYQDGVEGVWIELDGGSSMPRRCDAFIPRSAVFIEEQKPQ
jgi:hypothetical protein